MPQLLSQTGVFRDTRHLMVNDGHSLRPGRSFWSDGARKLRWASVPAAKVHFSQTGEWTFPNGTVFVKTFELPTDATHPETVTPPGDAPAGA